MLRSVVLLLGAMAISLGASSPTNEQPVPVKTTLCEIEADPARFQHQYVEFTATASHGFEDSMVEDASCPWAKTHVGVWMEFGGKQSTDTMYCCGFSPKATRPEELTVDGIALPLVKDTVFDRFNTLLHPPHKRPQRNSDMLQATMRGYIFAKQEGAMGTQVSSSWRGYGHMDCCILFVVQQVMLIQQAAPSARR